MYVADCQGCVNVLVRASTPGSKWNHARLQEDLRTNWHPPKPINIRTMKSVRDLEKP